MKKLQLTIPVPCHESWQGMGPSENGRFCASCQKTVIDFTGYSDTEMARYFQNAPANVCGRMTNDQLNRDLVLPAQPLPFFKYVIRILFPAFLISLKTQAQKGRILAGPDTVIISKNPHHTDTIAVTPEISVQGKVVDEFGQAVAFVTVTIIERNAVVKTDHKGCFMISAHSGEHIRFSAAGYIKEEMSITNKTMELNIVLKEDVTQVTKIITAGAVVSVKNSSIPLLQKIKDTLSRKILIYPNPVASMSTLHINPARLQAGRFIISVLNMEGEVLQTEDVFITEEKSPVRLQLKNIPAGSYLLHVFNRNNGQSFTETLVVQ